MFALVSVAVGFALTLLPQLRHDGSEVAAAVVPGIAVIGFSLLWRRRPAIAQTGVALGYLLFAALLRDSAGGTSSGFRDLLLLPIVWLGLTAGLAELAIGLTGLVVAQVVPLIAIGAPRYPAAGWQAVVVLTSVGAIAGYAIHRLTNEARANAVAAATNARQLIDLKDEFVAFVAHELRSPLASLIGYLELLYEESASALPDSSLGYLEVAQRNAERLGGIINDLLLVASLESGRFPLEHAPVELAEVIGESLERAQPAAEAKGIAVDATFTPPLHTIGDRMRLGQVVDNLLSNAIKFTPEQGRVGIDARGEGDSLIVIVRDTGIGIPTDEIENLFGQFFRASTAKEHGIPGTGLGLAITESIIRSHGGTIGLTSSIGVGTTFTITLPALGPSQHVASAALPNAEIVSA